MSQIPYISEAFEATKFGWTEEKVETEKGVRTKIIMEGEFQEADKQNANGRIYTEALLRRETTKLSEFINQRKGLPMGMDHPIPDPDKPKVSIAQMQRMGMENACAICTVLEMQNKVVYGKSTILEGDHGTGDKLATLVRNGFIPAVSSRGMGSEPKRDPRTGLIPVPEDYSMITYDYVTVPSTFNALLHQYNEELLYHIVESEKEFESNRKKFYSVMVDVAKKYGV